jgi:predicted nucleic acid-binding protein
MQAIFDTNVFIAAGFRRSSASAKLVALARDGTIRLVWDQPTRREARRLLEQIPRLTWESVEDLFTVGGEFTASRQPADFPQVRDPEDRKFAALAAAAGVPLVSSDQDLLEHQGGGAFEVKTPGEMLRCLNHAN